MHQTTFKISHKRANKWMSVLSLMLVTILLRETNGSAAVHDITGYSATNSARSTGACSGDCARGDDMSHVDSAAHCQPWAMRYCNFPIPLFYTALCSI